MFHYCGSNLHAVRWHPTGSRFTHVKTDLVHHVQENTTSSPQVYNLPVKTDAVCVPPRPHPSTPPSGDSVYKVHFFTPNFYPPGSGGCYDTGICMCYGKHVTRHEPPLIYDLLRDPSESRPLSSDTEPRYAEVLEQSAKAVQRHQREPVGAENQLTWEKILWKPWLQPCCGTFPFCGCKEERAHI